MHVGPRLYALRTPRPLLAGGSRYSVDLKSLRQSAVPYFSSLFLENLPIFSGQIIFVQRLIIRAVMDSWRDFSVHLKLLCLRGTTPLTDSFYSSFFEKFATRFGLFSGGTRFRCDSPGQYFSATADLTPTSTFIQVLRHD